MKKILTQLLLTLAMLAILTLTGCDDDKGPMQTAGEGTDNAVEATGETLKDAAHTTGSAVKGAAEKTGEFVGDAAKTTGSAVKGAAEKTGEVVGDAVK
ncbi:MAG: hypothetical protein ACYC3B_08330 [Sedimentisphaerales bacterium]